MSWPTIKKGEAIKCCLCNKEIYRARQDIPYMAPMASELLEFMDGSPVPFRSEKACPNCWVKFRSISTETHQTIL